MTRTARPCHAEPVGRGSVSGELQQAACWAPRPPDPLRQRVLFARHVGGVRLRSRSRAGRASSRPPPVEPANGVGVGQGEHVELVASCLEPPLDLAEPQPQALERAAGRARRPRREQAAARAPSRCRTGRARPRCRWTSAPRRARRCSRSARGPPRPPPHLRPLVRPAHPQRTQRGIVIRRDRELQFRAGTAGDAGSRTATSADRATRRSRRRCSACGRPPHARWVSHSTVPDGPCSCGPVQDGLDDLVGVGELDGTAHSTSSGPAITRSSAASRCSSPPRPPPRFSSSSAHKNALNHHHHLHTCSGDPHQVHRIAVGVDRHRAPQVLDPQRQ